MKKIIDRNGLVKKMLADKAEVSLLIREGREHEIKDKFKMATFDKDMKRKP